MNLTELTKYPKNKIRALVGLTPKPSPNCSCSPGPKSSKDAKSSRPTSPNENANPAADKRLYEASAVETAYPAAKKKGDLAYLGLPGVGAPHKKPRNGALTDEQKANNQQFSSGRVPVAHGIRRVKAFRILRDERRLGTGLFGMIASAPVGLFQLIRLVG